MVKIKSKMFLVTVFLALPVIIRAQGTIQVPARECLGNLTSLSYTPPSGLTLSSASWSFGDGFTSTNLAPVHTYAGKGTYTIVIQALLSNNTTATDSATIEVFGLPKAGFYMDVKSDSCLHRNKICYIDTSRPATGGQTITGRLFVWGDGQFSASTSPLYGQGICHVYALPDLYDLRMEVTDTFGCKNSVATSLNIIDDISAFFKFRKKFYDCNSSEVCVLNLSYGDTTKLGNYEWHIDTAAIDTTRAYSGFKCINLTGSKNSFISLVAWHNTICIDTFTLPLKLVVDPLPSKLELSDTVACFAADMLAEVSMHAVSRDTIHWYVDNGYDPFKTDTLEYFSMKKSPGNHEIRAEIIRGRCTTVLRTYFKVLGPVANMLFIDGDQCFSNRPVYFIETSLGVKRSDCIFRWHIRDSFGDVCTNNRAKDINNYKNCIHSVDWYTKHTFKKNGGDAYDISLFVRDTVSGCEDSFSTKLFMKVCSPLLDKDSVIICQGTRFLEDIPPPFPVAFTVDSAKQEWRVFPSLVDSPLLGNYNTGLIFKKVVSPWAENTGTDSFELHYDSMSYFDTVYLKDYLHVREKKEDSVWYRIHGHCNPMRLSVYFKKGLFNRGDSINVRWGIGSDGIKFDTLTKLDSVSYILHTTGINASLRVSLFNDIGCSTIRIFSLKRGKFLKLNRQLTGCLNKPVCKFNPGIYEIVPDNIWTFNIPENHVSWKFDDTSGVVDQFFACYRFKKPGMQGIKMFVQDSFGCHDTLSDSIFIQEPHAGIRHTAKIIYCSELKQFFDSSTVIKNRLDSIKKYFWQFGAGAFSSLQKNPLQSLNTSLDKIPASHVIETASGCLDTIDFEIQVIGPKPYFTIRDTIGCGSLNAVFDNLSRNCKQYIWQYGDSAQTTFQTFSKQPASFLYNKPGRYFISLVGIDTVFNPFTNSFQNCVATFPDKVFQKDTTRSVLVLPLRPTGISSRDTICLGSSLSFSSLSDTAYDNDEWNTGDTSSLIILPAGSSLSHTYKKTGVYTVRLKPGYNAALNNFCRDSAQKTVVVLGVKAGFDIDQASIPPVFRFHNTSQPASAALTWDFGHPGSGSSNSSSDNDPSHDYGKDTGTYTVCLVASLPEGCPDTICKTLFNDYMEAFGIYNVFTPGNIDNKNDQYDIQIENEDLYELMIYDRWGQLVFKANADDDADNPNWNGKVLNKGEDCPAGTYYYLFRYSLRHQPEILSVSGVITLIR